MEAITKKKMSLKVLRVGKERKKISVCASTLSIITSHLKIETIKALNAELKKVQHNSEI